MARSEINKKTFRIFYAILFGIFISSAYANVFLPAPQSESQYNKLHLIVGLGIGALFSSGADEPHTFPILNPITDELYVYSPTTSQTAYFYHGFFGAEWDWFSHWGVQAGFDYNQTSSFSAQGSFTQGADPQSTSMYTYHYDVDTKQLLLDGKLFYTLKKYFRPYILLGLGCSFNRANTYTTNVPPFLAFTRMYANNTTTSFSYAVGAGFDKDMTTHLRIDIGYRFTDFGASSLGNANIDGTSVTGTLSQSHLYANEVLTQLIYIFN